MIAGLVGEIFANHFFVLQLAHLLGHHQRIDIVLRHPIIARILQVRLRLATLPHRQRQSDFTFRHTQPYRA